MDELVHAASSGSSPSPASFFSTAGHHHREFDFASSDVLLDQWLGSNDCLVETLDGAAWGDEGSRSPAGHEPPGQPPSPAPKKRDRKPGPRTNGPAVNHVEAERQRRDKLNRRFCELRAAVPTVSRMDRASLLADAAAYIAELRGRVERLEGEAKHAAASSAAVAAATTVVALAPAHSLGVQEKLEVRMVRQEAAAAALRLTTTARNAPARFMLALRALDLSVEHACVCRVGGVTVHDAVVDVPVALRDERGLRAALLRCLQQSC